MVDFCLVEGAVSSEEDLHKIKMVREQTKTLISFGDCAVTANVPGMRNPIGPKPLLERAYLENVTLNPGIPLEVVPALLPMARPVHRVVKVDVFLPGCPPSADLIYQSLVDLLEGRHPGHGRRPLRPLSRAHDHRGTRRDQHHRHRPDHPDRGPQQDHHPARRRTAR